MASLGAELKSLLDTIVTEGYSEELYVFVGLASRFFEEHRCSDDGRWAPVTDDDKRNMMNIIWFLVEKKWSPDSDGDYPVSVTFTDRTRFHMLSEMNILHSPADMKELMYNFHAAGANLTSSMDILRLTVYEIEQELKKREDERETD